jgi:nitroreductase
MPSIPVSTLLSQLQWRYATKAFDPAQKIPAETWTALEDALVLTPSSFGLQPWKFLVITNPELREQLVPQAWGQRQVAEASHLVVMCVRTKIDVAFLDAYLQDMAAKRGIPVAALDQLRGMMVGFVEAMTDEQLDEWAAKQCYIALGNFMTAAALVGVDTCPMEGFVPAKFDEILGLNEQGLRSVVCCPAGYRSAEDKYASFAKVRWDKAQVIEHR